MYNVHVCVYMCSYVHVVFYPAASSLALITPFYYSSLVTFFLAISLSQRTRPHVANYTHRGVISVLSMSRSMLENRLRTFYDASVELRIRLVGV